MTINEHLIRVSAGVIPIEDGIVMGDDLTVKIEGTVTQITEKDNHDGTHNRVYTIKGIIAEVIQ